MTGAPRLVVVDYGAGNLRSLGGALDRIDANWRFAREPSDLDAADGIVLPGVGSAAPAMRVLRSRGLDRAIVGSHAPLLGICLGMQILCERLTEDEPVTGLGIVPGSVESLPDTVKRPHMGWNRVILTAPVRTEARGIERALEDWFYFAHSYAVRCSSRHVVATTSYGGMVPATITTGRAWGVQFHPEKSDRAGLALLAAFRDFCRGAKA